MLLAGAEPVSVVGGPYAAVCVHGFGGSPGSIGPLVEAFVGDGWSVEAPLLPGHGTTVADLAETGWDDWLGAVHAAVTDAWVGSGGGPVVIVGQSMGGSLALARAASAAGPAVAAVVCINAPVRPQDDETVAMVHELTAAGELTVPAGRPDLADTEAVDVAYDEMSLTAWLSLMAGLGGLLDVLGSVTVPTLVVTGALDSTVPAADGDALAAGVTGPVERLVLPGSAHVAALDRDRELLCERVLAFARSWAVSGPR